MRVLVATSAQQGKRANDFCWTLEGELVWVAVPCDRDRDGREGVDGRCGCRRSMAGIASCRATTTFCVADLDMTRPQYEQILAEHLSSNWSLDDPQAAEAAGLIAADLLRQAARFAEGVVLERRGDLIAAR